MVQGAISRGEEWYLNAPYSETTRSVTVRVESIFLEEQSSPATGEFVWAYWVRIENHGDCTVQLTHRHWKITDALGIVHEVTGVGVVGEQPILHPGDVFEYMSGVPLPTPSGIMVGSYLMKPEQGEDFNIIVPPFSLDSPFHFHRLN